MWCNGLSTNSTSKESVDETEPTSKKRKVQATKDEEVQKIVEKLTAKHGTNFTVQLRIRAEIINGGLCSSYDNPQLPPCFQGQVLHLRTVNQVIVHAANAIASSFQ